MSVVAYRNGKLAADSRAYGGDYITSPGQKRKIHRLLDGSMVGVTSAVVGMPERYVAWLNAGANPDKWGAGSPDGCMLMIKPNGDVFIAVDGLFFSGPIQCAYHAIGSGSKYAMGAMAMGASAEAAVKVACQFDSHCGGEVMVLEKTTV